MVIINQKTGRLANRLFTFSRFIANSIEYGYPLINPTFDEYCKYFKSTRNNDFGPFPISVNLASKLPYKLFYPLSTVRKTIRPKTGSYEYIIPKKSQHYNLNNPEFVKKAKKKTVYVHGWYFNDAVNMKKHAPVIRKLFNPGEDVNRFIQNILSPIHSEFDLLIGVHMRRGDYRAWQGGRYYYQDETYSFMMKQIADLFSETGQRVAFILCSNEEISEARYKNLNCFFPGGNLITDLYTLSQCHYIIGPPSTYTMWASYYGNTPLKHIKSPHEKIQLKSFTVLYNE